LLRGSISLGYTGSSLFNALVAEENMEKLIDLFCHAIRITDPLSIKIAVGMVGGGLPLLFLSALFVLLGELAVGQREAAMPHAPRPPSVKE
jgi:hypothetical protein